MPHRIQGFPQPRLIGIDPQRPLDGSNAFGRIAHLLQYHAHFCVDPRAPRLYLTRGQVYMLAEEPAKAVEDVEQVLALSQDDELTTRARELLGLLR